MKHQKTNETRRHFLKQSAIGSIAVTAGLSGLSRESDLRHLLTE
jgi:hypothetical protein